MTDELCFMPATELVAAIRRGDVSPVEVVAAHLDRIAARNPIVNAYVTVLDEEARRQAREAERAASSGRKLGPLHGIPIALKDYEYKAGVRNTFGSRPFRDFVPTESAIHVERLEEAGAIVLGKTNLPEFGHKGTTDNLLFGPTSTPHAPGKNAGGSSGGSAAAVADGMAALAQGGDGGGSIRIPASFCGVVGFKGSPGRIPHASRPNGFGSFKPFAHVGPLARTVEDAALMTSVMAGHDPRDPLCFPDGTDYLGAVHRSTAGLRIAYSPNFDVFPVDERVVAVVSEAVRAFEEVGARVDDVAIGLERPQAELAQAWRRWVAVEHAEMFASFKARGLDLLAHHREELTPELAESAEAGQRLSAVDYRADDVLRTEVFDALQRLFSRYDLLVTPTLAVPPFDNSDDGNTLGPSRIRGEAVDPLIGWCLTYPLNFTGHPAASVPAGFTEHLPIGMQIVGRRFEDDVVLAASAALERVRPWH